MTWLAHNTSSDSDGIGRPSRVHGMKRKAFLDLILLRQIVPALRR